MIFHPLAPRAITLAAACVVLAAGPARADTPPQVVVTAARELQPLNDALPHTTVLTRSDIERSQAIDLAALLASEAGVQFASNGPRGTATSLFLRGAQSRQVLVLVDGVPLSRQDATGQIGIEHLMLDQVERIEIVRGNASALYGAGAIGGVIQVFTSAAPGAGVSVEAGSRGLVHGAAGFGQRWGATQLSASVSGLRDRGYSAINPAEVPAANPDRDGYRNTSATLNLLHELSGQHRLAAGWLHTEGRLDYDSKFSAPADLQRARTTKDLVHLSSHNDWTARWSSRLRLSSQRETVHDDTTGDFGYRARYRTTVDSLNWDNGFALSSGLKLNAGLDHQRQRISADDGFGGLYNRGRDSSAVFGGARVGLGTHELAAQLRYDHVQGNDSRASGSLSWGWQFDPAWKAIATVANAFGVAPLGYLYAPYSGNPALKPEFSRSAELGLQWSVAQHRLRATLFSTRISDEIDYDFTTYTFSNLARTRNRGLELSYGGRFGGTDVRASLTSQKAEDGLTGAQRLRRSDILASLNLSHDLGAGWRAGLALRHAGERPDSGNQTLPAYTVGDITLQWAFSKALQFFARIENVADVHYETAKGYDQPARGVFAGVRWKLPL